MMFARCLVTVSICLAGLGIAVSAPLVAGPGLPSSKLHLIGCAYDPDPGSGTSARHVTRNNCPQDYDEVRRPAADYRSVRDRRYRDCHRDVRTHRIDGVRVRHRHVGDDCAVREVRVGS